MSELGRTAHALAMRPPLHNGGHTLVPIGDTSWWWCPFCHQGCPRWALTEGYVTTLLGRWCIGLFKMLGPAP